MNRLQYLILMAVLFAAVAVITYLIYRKKGKAAFIPFFVMTGVLLRMSYVFYTPHWVRQHDVVGFGNGIGQAAYIEWFYNNMKLPDFDPRQNWGFFQPPLHHLTSALFMRLQTLAGIAYTKVCENVMLLTLCYSLLMLYYAFRILKQMKLSGWPLYLSFALASIHPGFILLAGSINNDCLCELFMVMGLFFALEWYRNSTTANIIKTALCVGFSMFTKLSGVLIAPGIAMLFLIKWIKGGKTDFLKYLKQYVVFAIISIPLGLFYPVRNLIKFSVPINFTPEVGEPVGSYSLLQRLFDIRTATPFACMIDHGDPYDEFNIFLAMLKTSLFGETDLSVDIPKMIPFARAALITGALLAIFAFAATLIVLIRVIKGLISRRPAGTGDVEALTGRESVAGEPVEIIYWGVSYIVPVVFLINFSFSAPYFSSQDFRYIQYVIIIEALFTGLFFKQSENETRLGKTGLIYAVILSLFTISVISVYVLLGVASVDYLNGYLGI